MIRPRLDGAITMPNGASAGRSEVLQQPHIGTLRIASKGQAAAIRRRYGEPNGWVEPIECDLYAAAEGDIQHSRARAPGAPAHVAAHPYAFAVCGPIHARNESNPWHWNVSFRGIGEIKYPQCGRLVGVLRFGGHQIFSIGGKVPEIRPTLRFHLPYQKLRPFCARRIKAEKPDVFGLGFNLAVDAQSGR